MSRGGSAGASGGVRKKTRANSMGLQWWRKLTLPRRGKKDSLLQPSELTEEQQSRIGQRRAALMKSTKAPRVARAKSIAVADWDEEQGLARVTAMRGNAMQSMGVFQDGTQMLFPEEALFLVDRGGLDLCVHGLPASLQRAWAIAMAADNAVSLEEYLTFAYLRRSGYVVRRYESEEEKREDDIKLSFSAWRVGSFRRRDPIRPLFHVAVFRYEDSLPTFEQVARFLDNAGKSRLKFALIDRGVVVLKDVAMNATPLSERFVRRLSPEGQAKAREMEYSNSDDFIGPPLGYEVENAPEENGELTASKPNGMTLRRSTRNKRQ